MSLPAPPFKAFTPLLPVRVLFNVLPVALMAVEPLKVKFSKLLPNV